MSEKPVGTETLSALSCQGHIFERKGVQQASTIFDQAVHLNPINPLMMEV